MNVLILGNIIAFIGSTMQLTIGVIKNRKKALYVQTIQYSVFAISSLILGGFSGTIANIIGAIRNILTYNEKLTKCAIIIIILAATILTLYFNNLGILGLIPLVNTIIYTVFINVKDPLKFKLLFTFSTFLWVIYGVLIKSYTSTVFDSISTIGSLVSAYQIYKKQKNKKITSSK